MAADPHPHHRNVEHGAPGQGHAPHGGDAARSENLGDGMPSQHGAAHAHRRVDPGALSRRDFLRLGAAGLALAGLDGCTRLPAEHILPYVDNRPELTPGVAQQYATAMCVDGYATGLIVQSHVGRPTKVEGNPDHPASLGASGPLEQASVLQLYDPDRARYARVRAARSSWPRVAALLGPTALRRRLGARGEGLHLLIEPTSSPLDEVGLQRLVTLYPDARVHMYAPCVPERARHPLVQHFDIAAADVIVAVDNDFLASGPFHLRYARQFADGRRLAHPTDAMNRLYVVEAGVTPTGMAADHRFAVRPSEMAQVLRALLASVGGESNGVPAPDWVRGIGRDLLGHRGRAVVMVGERQPPEVLALGQAINSAIGATDRTTWYVPTPLIGAGLPLHPFEDLIAALGARAVDTLVVSGGNPVYATPAALRLGELIGRVPNAGYLGPYENETAAAVRWFVPMSHYLERWGDARAYDGTLSIVQPLVNPLYQTIAPAELYAVLAGTPADRASAYTLLREAWNARRGANAEVEWNAALQRGVVADTAFARAPAAVLAAAPGTAAAARASAPGNPAPGGGNPRPDDNAIEVLYVADLKIHDGSFANNGWLQELPGPATQLTWGNAAELAPATARRLGVHSGDVVTLTTGRRNLSVPVLIVPGHADGCVTLPFGYGRAGRESLALGVGANAFALWPATGARSEAGVALARTGATSELALAQTESAMEPSRPVRAATLSEYRAAPSSLGQGPPTRRALSLFPQPDPPVGIHGTPQWAMTIDLGTCIGCGACVVACQAENNIPVVGADQARRGRAMQWIHIDRYFEDHEHGVEALLQPMLCQHCEKAPCEYVCPVEATVHSPDGLNEMVYNRCVGTRFCSNNCPYKVRRFNWFDYNADLSETEWMVKNPNVTVRDRGVMEKCTFCVQRIREAGIAAERQGREVRGSEVRTACQQACPTNAIVFGSLSEVESEMVRRREQPRSYAALHELGTEPRVRYLARVRNPNPDISKDR